MLRVLVSKQEQVMHSDLTPCAIGSKAVTPVRASIIWPDFMHIHSGREFWGSSKSFRTKFQEFRMSRKCFASVPLENCEADYCKRALFIAQHLACQCWTIRFCRRYRKTRTQPGRSRNGTGARKWRYVMSCLIEMALLRNVMFNRVNLGWVEGGADMWEEEADLEESDSI